MEIKRITEVGVVVKNLEKATAVFVELLGAQAGEIITVKRYQMRYRMCRLGQVDFELMEPLDDKGLIANYLKNKGEGLHHIAFGVDDLTDGFNSLKKKGVKFVDSEIQEMSGESIDMQGNSIKGVSKLAFAHPAFFNGVLLEFIEYPKKFKF